jgi:hypothetical protein
MALVLAGSAVQVATGAGFSVICGPFLMLWLGPAAGVPILLSLNLLISVVATVCDGRRVLWADAVLAAGTTLAGCALASLIPGLPDSALKLLTACVLVVVALPRPPASDKPPGAAAAAAGIMLASLVAGALTVWTATPGPITPVALARAGRSGTDIRRTMQPISIVGYGTALLWAGTPTVGVLEAPFPALVGATMLGTGTGFVLRRYVNATRVILFVRIVAAAAATLLIASVLLEVKDL